MLVKAKTLKGYKLHCLDGEIGKVKEFYFDDQFWTIRYLIADTGNWLPGRKVLISPYALVCINKEEQYIAINLTKTQVENSPPLSSDKPVSRQFEELYYGYYQWPLYWGGPLMWGPYPSIVRNFDDKQKDIPPNEKMWDPHLRSTHDVSGHHIHAVDGDLGHVTDFLIDDVTWAIRYLIVETSNWWLGKKVLISTRWIERISWDEAKVFVNLLREDIKKSPEYPEGDLLIRDYEAELHHHYGRQEYWVDEPTANELGR